MSSDMQRASTADGVVYVDPDVHSAAEVLFTEWEFSLPKLDDWIEQRCTSDRADEVRRFRSMLMRAVHDGNSAAVLPWLMHFTTLIDLDIRETVLGPLATKQVRRDKVQRKIQKKGADAVRVYSDADREQWRTLYRTDLAGHSKIRAATLIRQRLGLPEEAEHTIRKAL